MPKKELAVRTYPVLLSQLKKVFIEGLQKIEEERVRTYWRTGELISNYILENKQRAEYGKNLFKKLGSDLGIHSKTLERTVKFYKAFPISTALSKLSWLHQLQLITIKDKEKRKVFADKAAKKGWGYRELEEAIRLDKLEIEEPKKKPIPSDYKLPVIRSRLYTYKVLEPSYINATEETVVVDVGFYINAQVALKGIARPRDGQIVESIKSGSSYTFKTSDAKPRELYTYKALVERVVDADTIWLNIDCGFDIWYREKVRLRGIDAPEISTEQGQRAKKFVEARLKEAKFVVVKTYKEDKYERFLTDLFYQKDATDPQAVLEQSTFLNQELLDLGLASAWREDD